MAGAPRSELRTRLVSAAVGLPLLFLVLWAGGPWFVGVASATAVFVLREMLDLLRRARALRGPGPALRDGAITVTEVELGPDLRHATAYVLPFGAIDAHEMLAGLVRTTPFLRREVSRRVRLKYMPSLAFALDRRFDHAERIDALLRRPEVARDIAGPRPGGSANGHEPETEG